MDSILSEEEFIALVQKNQGILQKIIGFYADHEADRQDLYQEMLLQLWKAKNHFQGYSKASTWLYRVCLNTALNFNKTKTKYKYQSIEESDLSHSDDKKPEDYEALYNAIRQLQEIDRMIITLSLEGYKNTEISEITGISANHINVKIHRIKTSLIKQINKD